jgi:hypothetical protein
MSSRSRGLFKKLQTGYASSFIGVSSLTFIISCPRELPYYTLNISLFAFQKRFAAGKSFTRESPVPSGPPARAAAMVSAAGWRVPIANGSYQIEIKGLKGEP